MLPSLVALVLGLMAAPVFAQVADPVPDIPQGIRVVTVETVVTLPDTGSASRPRARPMTLIGDGSGRRFVVDQNGSIYQLHADDSISVFLDVATATDLIADQGQRGVSSAAFHPDYHVVGAAGEGLFYTSSQHPADVTPDFPLPGGAAAVHHSVLTEWWVDSGDADAIDPTSARELLRIAEAYPDHNMGQIAFDPNLGSMDPDYGLLYIAMGDGGNVCCPRSSVDPLFVGQDLSSPLGTMLRIDPLESGADPYSIPLSNFFAADGDPTTLGEIWAYGLRNPHRFAWDEGGTGRMLISDIGQANVEEIILGANGANLGWSEREGTYRVEHFNEDDVFPLLPGDELLGFTYPVLQYDHDEDDHAISGGSVYRGTVVPSLANHYVFGDLVSGRIFVAPIDALDGSRVSPFETLRLIDAADGTEKSLLSIIGGASPAPRADLRFGSDDDGEIYLVSKQDGTIRRLAAAPICNDGIDNDLDGRTDFDPLTQDDPLFLAGAGDPACVYSDWPRESTRCQDGVNNDGDGLIDFDGGQSIHGACTPGAGGCPSGVSDPDNDGVGDPDPQCVGIPRRNDERKSRCGLGAELALGMAGLLWLRREREIRDEP